MSRGRDDDRANVVERGQDRLRDARAQDRIGVPARDLPRGEERELVEFRGRTYSLNGAETRTLTTVGTFRVVPTNDLKQAGDSGDAGRGACRRLVEQGLLTRETLTDRTGARHVVALTREGKALLDAHSPKRTDGRDQHFYAGIVKPRELRHDAQLYRVYQAEAAQIAREGGTLDDAIRLLEVEDFGSARGEIVETAHLRQGYGGQPSPAL